MAASLSRVLLFLCLFLLATEGEKYSIYVLPTNPEHSISPCDDPSNTTLHHNCSDVTLNELIDDHDRFQIGENDLEVRFLSGVHVVNGVQQSQHLSLNRPKKVTFLGEDVFIICEKRVYFEFVGVEQITMSNIHFKNCVGRPNGSDYCTTLNIWCSKKRDCNVSLYRIQIANENDKAIVVQFTETGAHRQSFTLVNSTISSRDTGVLISANQILHYKVNISDTSFNGSCLMITGTSRDIHVRNTTFRRCFCSPVVSVDTLSKQGSLILDNITIKDTGSQYLILSLTQLITTLRGHCYFIRNRGTIFISSNHSILAFSEAKVEFTDNRIGQYFEIPSSLVVTDGGIVAFKNSLVVFRKNYGEDCGGIVAMNGAEVCFKDSTAEFIDNYGYHGGAMAFYSLSLLSLQGCKLENNYNNRSIVTFVNNKAYFEGGAIFVDDSSYILDHKLQKSFLHVDRMKTALVFSNNSAKYGGNNIYGGWVDYWYNNKKLERNYRIPAVLQFEDGNPGITSEPTRICMCTNSVPNCDISEIERVIYPGESIALDAVAVGQRNGTVKTPVIAKTVDGVGQRQVIKSDDSTQTLQNDCTTLNYAIHSSDREETITITVLQNSRGISLFDPHQWNEYPKELEYLFKDFTIKIQLKECPLAFPLDETEHSCTCLPSLESLGLSCNLSMHKIYRTGQQWIGLTEVHTIEGEDPGVILHQYCPLDYCRTDQESLLVSLEYRDEQCAFNRSGVLCGGCQTNFSRVLGSSKCKKCSNLILLTVFPGIISGLLLVIVLMLLNLTVSVGTINGLIFYANIIQIQHANFFTPESSNSFLGLFISWLNFDQGIESCFYDGFDAYTEAWLQFCFPLYIWLLVAIIIISSHYSTLISKLSGKNAVQVLATLWLLSYTKLLRFSIDVFSATKLTYPDGYTKLVWLHDGNIDFLKGKHIPLFIATLLFLVFLSVPYTFSLVSIQWLLKISHYRALFWVQKLKPLFDAYTGPYKANHRYWTGLLLLVRIVLLIIFSFVNQGAVSLLIIAIFSMALQTWLCLARWVYEDFINNFLEMAFLLNLAITSAAILFEYSVHKIRHSSTVIYISSGMTFVIFIGIIVYHVLMRLMSIRVVKKRLGSLRLRKDREAMRVLELQTQLSESESVTESDNLSYGEFENTKYTL